MHTHGHRKYTMSEAARNQRRIARMARVNAPSHNPKGKTIGLHITPQAAAIVLSYPQGKTRRKFISSAILQYPPCGLSADTPLTIPRNM